MFHTFSVKEGHQVASVIFSQLRLEMEEVMLVTPYLHDYYWPLHARYLAVLLEGQITDHAARVTVLTRSPKTETTPDNQKRKLELLSKLAQAGIDVQVNERIHAKVFLFKQRGFPSNSESSLGRCWVLGSANLTKPALREDGNLELSLQGYRDEDYGRIRKKVLRYVGHGETLEFSQWKAVERNYVGLLQVRRRDK